MRSYQLLAAALAFWLAGCTTTVPGAAVKAHVNGNDAIVALMDTGSYPTTAGPPPGNAGNDHEKEALAEVQRMAPYVTGPWQVDTALVDQDFLASAILGEPFNAGTALSYPIDGDWADRLTRVAESHTFMNGLTTGRTAKGQTVRLQNAVLRFPDPKAAADAAADLAAVNPNGLFRAIFVWPQLRADSRPFDSPWQPETCGDLSTGSFHPGFAASARLGDHLVIRSFTAHGVYVLYQLVVSQGHEACETVGETLLAQQPSIDRFVPADPAKLADLPQDPSGYLGARTLWESAPTRTPWSAGVWQPDGWLHFADEDPIKTAALFKDAGVQWVSQQLTTVYQARDPTGATRVVDQLASDTRDLPDVEPTHDGVRGFPAARCFNRGSWKELKSPLLKSNQHAWWHFKCIGQVGRYAFTAFSHDEHDVKQQISAQYRILAGE